MRTTVVGGGGAVGGGTVSYCTGVAGGGFPRIDGACMPWPGADAPDALATPLVRCGVAVAAGSVLGAVAATAVLRALAAAAVLGAVAAAAVVDAVAAAAVVGAVAAAAVLGAVAAGALSWIFTYSWGSSDHGSLAMDLFRRAFFTAFRTF